MLAVDSRGTQGPTLILMHFLGGSAREWLEVVAELRGRHTVAMDLPGFGDSAEIPGYSVAAMADAVQKTIASLALTGYVLVGHSMSGKVAAVIASRRPPGLRGMVLIAPSPLAPEPMTEQKRAAMLESLGEAREGDLQRAGQYVTKNEARVLEPAVQARATEDVLRMNRAAWRAWVEQGSREDWTGRIESLAQPTLVVVGAKDSSLGREVQERLTLPYFTRATLEQVPDCGHLIPMEKPVEMARILEAFLVRLNTAAVPAEYLELIHSERVSPRTRELLMARVEPRPDAPLALSAAQRQTLRAVVDRVIPQPYEAIDIAGFIDQRLAAGTGDGWRYDLLPPDREAYGLGLDALDEMALLLHEQRFAALPPGEQDELLTQISVQGPMERPQLSRWFEDVRADAAQIWMAHPATLARIGYSGIGIGGAHTRYAGFVAIGPGVVEDWEPEAKAASETGVQL